MPLSNEYIKYLEDTIERIIAGVPALQKEYPKFKSDWKFDNEFDFH